MEALTSQLLQNLVLENEYVLVLVFFLDLKGDILLQLVVKRLVNNALKISKLKRLLKVPCPNL